MQGGNSHSIVCEKLTKKFGSFTAVDGLSLQVKRGELFGFLGPNGAGKTTTINMLTTLLPKSGGRATVAGFDLDTQAALIRSRIGVVPQKFSLFEELTPAENLWYLGQLYEMGKWDIERRSDELLKIVGLHEKKDVQSGTFSGGMKQRLSVAAGLLHQPQILFMDEPTTGLDPQSRIALRELTASLNQSGITVIYTTHDMEEADKLCQRIAIMDYGKLIALGAPSELKELQGHAHKIRMQMPGISSKIVEELKALTGALSATAEGEYVELRLKKLKPGLLHALTDFINKRKLEMMDLAISEPTLEDVFVGLTNKRLRD